LSEHLVIREKVQGLLAELRYEMALAKLEMAYANVLAAIGEDPFPVTLSDEEVDQLAGELQQRWEWLGQHASVSKLASKQETSHESEQELQHEPKQEQKSGEGGVQP
ncbi:MAG: hypothetical protein OEY57_12830, partial [Nitrospirota bacterium]|nr:hypothetical protein [Nitrospirota bacterium]